jgi:hypothetical protein
VFHVRGGISAVLFEALVGLAHAGPVGFIDAATRFAIEPAAVSAIAEGSGFRIRAPGYRSRSFSSFPNDGITRLIVLEREEVPAEIHPDTIALMHRRDATVAVGYVGDGANGRPLADVSVSSGQGITATDGRGYFQIYLPCRSDRDRGALIFSKAGFQTQERANIDLYPFGDYIYRIQLERGHGRARVSDRPARLGVSAEPEAEIVVSTSSAAGSNVVSIPRVPTNIRVIDTNGVVYYETLENYCRHSLRSEWIASWADYTGGSNSLNAGAVAIRTYAVGYVNSPRGADHDICGWTACQVYNPTLSDSRTTRAVDFTAGCVMVNVNNAIPRGLTEYSAENNQLGMPCGDGYTAPSGGCLADPVCSGEPENGHGRGMCQWGSIRWASGLKLPAHNNDGSTNGQPRQDWRWILEHYYPNLRLVQASPLGLGDPVRVIGVSTPLNVRSCPGATITNGVNCPSIGTQSLGSLGYIIGGPERVTADGQGYTWWKVHWQNGVEGWSAENYLDRFIPTNTAPQIATVPDAIIHAGTTFRITNSATDTDFPPNTLTYLLPIRPIGASLDSINGVLVWPSPANSAGTTNTFTVRVTDNGSPPLSASTSFQVRVIAPPQLTASIISPPSIRLTWTSAPKSRYRTYYTGSLSMPNWLPLGGILTATGSTMTFTDNPGTTAQRFYRIVVLE